MENSSIFKTIQRQWRISRNPSLKITIDVFFFDFNINEDFTITQTAPRSYLPISIGISHQQHDRYETIQIGMIIPDCFIQEEYIPICDNKHNTTCTVATTCSNSKRGDKHDKVDNVHPINRQWC